MPFDRSGEDLTAHAVRALHAWSTDGPSALDDRSRQAVLRGMRYLESRQRKDGSWVPLWFGNQHLPGEENPIYGTARVLLAYRDLGEIASVPAQRGLEWLTAQGDSEGGWGGSVDGTGEATNKPSVEEIAMAVDALLAAPEGLSKPALARGIDWLVRAVEGEKHLESAPIGLYFARLWYYERLYPLVFVVSALGQAVRRWPADD